LPANENEKLTNQVKLNEYLPLIEALVDPPSASVTSPLVLASRSL
jgi:hypothetical protein